MACTRSELDAELECRLCADASTLVRALTESLVARGGDDGGARTSSRMKLELFGPHFSDAELDTPVTLPPGRFEAGDQADPDRI